MIVTKNHGVNGITLVQAQLNRIHDDSKIMSNLTNWFSVIKLQSKLIATGLANWNDCCTV